MADNLLPVVSRLEAVASRLERCGVTDLAGVSVPEEALAPFVAAFDEFLAGPFTGYVQVAKKLGGEVATHTDMVHKAFRAQREFVLLASKCKKPGDSAVAALLKPQADIISEITEFREKNRRSPFFNHLSTISESIAALSWVVTAPTPGPLIKEMNDAGLFWGNRVIKENKAHQNFTRSWSAALQALQAYVKQYHTTGLSWNPRGGDASQLSTAAGGSQAAGRGAPPPPPPPPPAAPVQLGDSREADSATKRAALFGDINRGSDVTQGLRKVTRDMQTHKNPDLRVKAPVPPVVAAKPSGSRFANGSSSASAAANKPAVCELQGKKWAIEYQSGRRDLVLSDTAMSQAVYMYKCQDSVIQVKGKVNSIIMDSCKKTALVFDSVVASVEFVNCISCQMQGTGKVPTISVDKTDGLQMYVSESSMDVVLVTSKSSEMNLLIPKGDGDYTEVPVPEQFKTVISGKKLVTSVNEST